MARKDHGKDLIHFTKGFADGTNTWDYEASYQRFKSIVNTGQINATVNLRLGNIPSICFTEAPFPCLTRKRKLDEKYFSKYSPFGFLFSKEYIYKKGGLPVVYIPPNQFEPLNQNINWRSVSYNPENIQGVWKDFTFEREWRLKPEGGSLGLEKDQVRLVFPSMQWAERFRDEHDAFHEDPDCECPCTRHCTIVRTQSYYSKDHETLEGSCFNTEAFPWVLLSMDCREIPNP